LFVVFPIDNYFDMLYPLQFKPILKERIWGGHTLVETRGTTKQKADQGLLIGESWEISGVEGDVSVAANGFLKGNNLQELIEVYMGELVGDKVFERFGVEFPLLIKYIDAQDKLSVQVHPGDKLAAGRHGAFGKTEMWYVLDCEPGAHLLIGLKEGTTKEDYLRSVENGTVGELLNAVAVKPGDAYFIPAGTVHAIGKGMLIAEIQQTSDVTYRVFDWNRTDREGNPRELHTELALDAIDFAAPVRNITRHPESNATALLVESPYFTTNLLNVAGTVERTLEIRDSFTIYICTSGEVSLRGRGGEVTLCKDDIVLIPAEEEAITLTGNATLLETYV
jgi:mannose-6-phosphate isomerase